MLHDLSEIAEVHAIQMPPFFEDPMNEAVRLCKQEQNCYIDWASILACSRQISLFI